MQSIPRNGGFEGVSSPFLPKAMAGALWAVTLLKAAGSGQIRTLPARAVLSTWIERARETSPPAPLRGGEGAHSFPFPFVEGRGPGG